MNLSAAGRLGTPGFRAAGRSFFRPSPGPLAGAPEASRRLAIAP